MISVLILTHNRSTLLEKCLASLAGNSRRADEVLVLLTGEDEKSETILQKSILPGLRWIQWNALGSYAEARNRLVHEAKGDKLAFIDDDCVADRDWLERVDNNLDKWDAAGGWVEPVNGLNYPVWWHPDMAWLAGYSVPGLLSRAAGSVFYPQTANLAVRRSVLAAEPFQELGGKFHSDAGADSRQNYALGREDVELWRRLRRAGYAVGFDPGMVARHRIPQTRLTWNWLLERARNDGRAYARREMNRTAMRHAAVDKLYLPLAIAKEWLRDPLPGSPQRAMDRLWLERQRAYWAEFRRLVDEGEERKTPAKAPEPHKEDLKRAMRRAQWDAASHMARSEFKRPAGQAVAAWRRVLASRKSIDIPPRRPLVAMAGFLGDLILALPAIAAWRRANPGMPVDLGVTSEAARELAAGESLFDRVWLLHSESVNGGNAIARLVERNNYDLIVAPYFHTSKYDRTNELFARKAPPVIAFDDDNGMTRSSDRQGAAIRLLRTFNKPETLALADLFSLAGPMAPLEPYSFALTDGERRVGDGIVQSLDNGKGKWIAIHPDAGYREKLWVWERWFELADLLEDAGHRCVFLHDGAQEEKIRADLTRRSSRAVCAPAMPIRVVAAFLERCDLFIGLDSGPKHLAAAMGTPTVAIHGPTAESRWRPYFDADRHVAVRRCAWDLTGEELDGLAPNHACSLVQTADVASAALVLLQATRGGARDAKRLVAREGNA